jgi:hypothetical protein
MHTITTADKRTVLFANAEQKNITSSCLLFHAIKLLKRKKVSVMHTVPEAILKDRDQQPQQKIAGDKRHDYCSMHG